MISTFATPLIESYLKDQDGKLPSWFDEALSLIDHATANAKAGVAFDEALAARVSARLATLPLSPTSEDFATIGSQIRETYADFKSVMAARRDA